MGRKKNDGRGRLGGRQKGTPNNEKRSITKATFMRITEQMLLPDPTHPDGLSKFEQHLALLEGKEWIDAVLKMTEFHTGKIKSVDMTLEDVTNNLTIDARLKMLSGEE